MTVSQQDKYDQINDHALPILHALLREWFPLGRLISKTEYGVANLNGDEGESLSINIQTGRWKEFAGGPGGYEPLGLYAHAFCGGDRKIAFKELRAKFGLEDSPPPARTKNPPKLTVVKKEDDWLSIVPPPDSVGVPNLGNATKHTYLGPGDKVLRYVARIEKPDSTKIFVPHTYGVLEGVKGWHKRHPNKPMCLYGLNHLAAKPDAPKLLQEGELKTNLVQAKLSGWACLGWSGGANMVGDHDYRPLVSGGPVYVCGDAVDGQRAMWRAAEILHGLGANVWTVDTTGFPKGWDLGNAATGEMTKKEVSWKEAPWSGAKIEAFIRDNAKLYDPDPGNVDIDDVDLGEPTHEDDSEWLKDPEEHATDTEGVLPLGHDNGIFYYLSRGTGQVHGLTPARHTELELIGLADPIRFWEQCGIFKKDKSDAGWDHKKAATWMMHWCRLRGIYNPDRQRGRGAWLDNGRPLLNLGNRLIVKGETHPLKLPGSEYIYEAGATVNQTVAPPIDATTAGELAEICKLFRWEREISATLMAGWLVIAPICGALPWRPSIWVSGGSGSGKTTLETRIVRPVLGRIGLRVQGGTTEAGIRQILMRDARPVAFDEADAENAHGKMRIQSILDLVRQSSSEGGAEIVKGTQAQSGAKRYHIRSCFMFSSINVTMDHLADESRITVLELRNAAAGCQDEFDALLARIESSITPEFCAGLLARAVWLMPVILRNAATFARAVTTHLGNSRVGDQIGTLLAGRYALLSDDEVTPEQAKKWVEKQDWGGLTSATAAPDEERLTLRLIQQKIKVDLGDKVIERTVGEVLEEAAKDTGTDSMADLMARNYQNALKRVGLKFEDGGVWVSNTHHEIKTWLKDSPWASQWGRSLKRIPGAKTSEPKVIVFGKWDKTKAVWLPLAAFER
jgi:putative DNA primase/helicase